MKSFLKITEATGNRWDVDLETGETYTIGRAKENHIVLNDRRVSRHHAHIAAFGDVFKIVDGFVVDGEIKRSVNRVFVNGLPMFEKVLEPGDLVTIGESRLEYQTESSAESLSNDITQMPSSVSFDDQPLGHTQLLISARDIIGKHSHLSIEAEMISPQEVKDLRRKAQILEMLYDMSKTLGTVFDLKEIFTRATDLIFRGTPSDRVVALLADETLDGKIIEYSLVPIAIQARDEKLANVTDRLTVSRTITQKVMREKIAILSQDAKTDAQFSGSDSIVTQGVRSTICAPLLTESNVHGVVYADRLDPFASFSPDDLELISAVAAQTAMAVETSKAHKRLAREEVARANYSRFMPEYVVKQLLDSPNSFRLGGINQKVTVLFADIRGFTSMSEKESPEKVVGLLNRYFTAMSEIIFAFGGTLDKYIGDGLMAIFGAPTASEEDARNAVRTAVAMQQRVAKLNDELAADGLNGVQVGLGLHTGIATIGYIGSERRSEYTAIGDTVNLAARLEQNSKGGQILVSDATANECGELVTLVSQPPLTVKNRLQPVTVFEVKWK